MDMKIIARFILYFLATPAFAVPGSLTYQGRIKNTHGEALEVNGVQFEFSIMNPAGTCTIYRETSLAIDMRNSGGVFDVPIGTGTKNFPAAAGFKLLDSFDNSVPLNCESGGTYTPIADDKRLLRVQFYDGTGWRLISPDNEIRAVPFAGHAKFAQSAQKLGTNLPADFILKTDVPLCAAGQYLRHISPAGTFECSAPTVSGSNVTGNISGSSAGFTGSLAGDVSGTQGATSVDKIKGVALDMTGIASGKVLKYNGTSWVPGDDQGTTGAITSLSGDVTSTGSPTATVTLSDNSVSTNKISDGAVNSAKISDGTIVDADIASGAAIADSKLATIATAGKVSGNAITSGTIGGTTSINTSGAIQTSSGLRLYQGSNYVELKAPATLSSDFTFQLPAATGTSGQVLITDGTGILSWSSLGAADIPNMTGDVTSTGGTANTKVEKIQGVAVSSSTPQTGQVLVHNGTQWDVQYFGFGQLRSTVTGSAQVPSSCSTADKTLTWSAVTDTFICSNIAIANTQVSGLGTASTKDFGTAAGNLVALDGSAKIPVSLLPQGAGGVIIDGGNSTASTLTVGTNDANALILKTNNSSRLTVSSLGDVYIGAGGNSNFSTSEDLTVNGNAEVHGPSGIMVGSSQGLFLVTNGNTNRRMISITGAATSSPESTGFLVLGNNRATAASGDNLGTIEFGSANNGSLSANRSGGRIETKLSGSGGTNGLGAYMTFSTKQDNGGIQERMRITDAGAVGIGTTSPQEKLHIDAPSVGRMQVGTGNIFSTSGYGVSLESDTDDGVAYINAHTQAIGANVAAVTIRGGHGATETASTRNIATFKTDTGNVGIGVTNPASKLEVNGGIKQANSGTITVVRTSGGITASVPWTPAEIVARAGETHFWDAAGPILQDNVAGCNAGPDPGYKFDSVATTWGGPYHVIFHNQSGNATLHVEWSGWQVSLKNSAGTEVANGMGQVMATLYYDPGVGNWTVQHMMGRVNNTNFTCW